MNSDEITQDLITSLIGLVIILFINTLIEVNVLKIS